MRTLSGPRSCPLDVPKIPKLALIEDGNLDETLDIFQALSEEMSWVLW
jgi:hypothetical protein